MDVTYRFNGYTVDPVRRLLFGRDGQVIPLKPRVVDTLLYLVEHRGELLEKQALLEAIWPGVVVEENNLNQAISTLRRVFGETRGENSFIVTEPGRGYRFVAPVDVEPAEPRAPERARGRLTRVAMAGGIALLLVAAFFVYRFEQPAQPAPADLASRPPIPGQSVAVLPFADLSEHGDRAWLVDGLTEEILNSLAQLPDLKVSGKTSSFQFRDAQSDVAEIADRLEVAHVLEGSVRLVGDELRVTAQLIRADDGVHLWSNTYGGRASELLDFQREVAERVAGALDIVLDERLRERMFAGGTRNVAAFEAYQQGWRVAGEARAGRAWEWDAIPHFERALTLDPGYALAALGKTMMLQNVLLLENPEAPHTQTDALEQMRAGYAFVAAHGTTPTMRLVAEINLESLSPAWHRMPALLDRLRAEQDFDGVLRGGDGAGWLPVVLGVTNQHDLLRALAERQVAIDSLAVNAWIRRAQAERWSGDLDTARNVLAEARQVIGREPVYDLIEYNIAREEGKRDEAIGYLSGRRDPGATMFLTAVRGDYEAALRMADDVEAVQRPPSFAHSWLLDTYYELGATERLEVLVKRIDDSPQGTAILMQILAQSAGLAFDLNDAPNFAAKLRQSGLDPASYRPPLPRLSATP